MYEDVWDEPKHPHPYNFLARKQKTGECLESGILISSSPSCNPLKWKLNLYPKGRNNEAKDRLSIYIYLVDFAANDEVWSKQTYWIRDSKGVDKMQKNTENYKFIKNGPGSGFHQFIKRSELLNGSSGLLHNDQLTIVCQVTVYGEETVECIQTAATEFQIPEWRTFADMSNLFDKSLFTDLVLVASSDDKEFKVNKCILASRSPVFAAMFQHEMTESKEGVVKIDDIESAVLEQTLRFIYSGTAPKLAEMAEELLEAADKYQLDRLKILCERQLANSLGNENACKLLALAHRHSAENLKSFFQREFAQFFYEMDSHPKITNKKIPIKMSSTSFRTPIHCLSIGKWSTLYEKCPRKNFIVKRPTCPTRKLLADLNEVKKTIRDGEKPKEMELFEKCQKMFAPLKESRQVLKKIRSILSEFGYIDSDDEEILKEAVAFYNAHKTTMLEEVEKKGYKKSVEALQKMADAFDKLKIGEITKWAGLAEEEMLREIFGLQGILEQYSVTY